MAVQSPFKRNDWVFHTGPWFGPFVFQWTYRKIWTFWLWKFFINDWFWPGCKLILCPLLVLRILEALLWHPLLWSISVRSLVIDEVRHVKEHLARTIPVLLPWLDRVTLVLCHEGRWTWHWRWCRRCPFSRGLYNLRSGVTWKRFVRSSWST